MQAYSNPARESDPHALPDVEYWYSTVYEMTHDKCGVYDIDEASATVVSEAELVCVSCEQSGVTVAATERKAWWWWSCFPGCLPDSDPVGPFASEAECIADFQAGAV